MGNEVHTDHTMPSQYPAMGDIVGGKSGLLPLESVSVGLTADQIATLNTVPVELVAGSPGEILLPQSCALAYVPGEVGFDNAPTVRISVASVEMVQQVASVPFDVVGHFSALMIPVTSSLQDSGSNMAGEPIVLFATVDPDGAGDGTLTVKLVFWRLPSE